MTWFEDLTPYSYSEALDSKTTLNVGWLDATHPVPSGDVPAPLIARLATLVEHAQTQATRGKHECELCPPSTDRDRAWGSAEIRAVASDGTRFAAPSLIHHYVTVHRYAPPQVFIDAVLRGSVRWADAESRDLCMSCGAQLRRTSSIHGLVRGPGGDSFTSVTLACGTCGTDYLRVFPEATRSPLVRALERMREDPSAFLTDTCALALRAFLSGFAITQPTSELDLEALSERSGQRGACRRAYLRSPNTEVAYRRAVAALLAPNPAPSPSAPSPSNADIPRHFVEFVREPITNDRIDEIFDEPTVSWCANYWSGFLTGLATTDAAAADAERARFDEFERWLNARYVTTTRWFANVRVFGGAGLAGLRAFLALWDEFTAYVATAWDRIRERLASSDAVALERLARGGGATNLYYCRGTSDLHAVAGMLSAGSAVSFYFDDRIRRSLPSAAVDAEIENIITRTGDAVVGVLEADGMRIESQLVVSRGDLDEFMANVPSTAELFYGAFPSRDNDGICAITVVLPDADGVVRGHPH